MEIASVVERIVKFDRPVCPILYRSFVQSEFSLLFVRRMNDFLQQHPEMKDVVFVITVYPAIKWALSNEKSSEAILCLLGDEGNVSIFNQTKTVVEKITQTSLDELIKLRKNYIENCFVLATGIESAINKIGTYPGHGKMYQAILRVALGIDKEKKRELSRYNVNKYFPEVLKLMYRCLKEQSLVINKVLTGTLPSDEANSAMCRGTLQMLQEYTQLMWFSKNSKKQSGVEIEKYLELMNRAVEKLKEFPSTGDVYYSIIQTLTQLKPLGIPDEAVAEHLNMSTYTFSIKKRRALLALYSEIFGHEGDIYVKLLTDKI